MLRGDILLIAVTSHRLFNTLGVHACPSLTRLPFSHLPFARLRHDRRAVTALEYAILAAALGLVLITLFSNFQEKLSMLFAPIDQAIPAPPAIPPTP